jgi:hypothetical protein
MAGFAEADLAAARRFFAGALNAARRPTEVTTDRAPAYPRVLDELVPEAWHVVEQYANNPIESDHGHLKARTRPMRGLKRLAARPPGGPRPGRSPGRPPGHCAVRGGASRRRPGGRLPNGMSPAAGRHRLARRGAVLHVAALR